MRDLIERLVDTTLPSTWVMRKEAANEIERLTIQLVMAKDVLEFYANPDNYIAIMIVGDRPCGDFIDDFSHDEWVKEWCEFDRPMPGMRAREALSRLTDEKVEQQ